jgi:hypothetical protein
MLFTCCKANVRVYFAMLLIVFGINLPMPSLAQSTYGSIVGTVKDPSGAAISGARVTITNTDEQTSREVTTDKSGSYESLDLLPAHYEVTIEQTGFAVSHTSGLVLLARQTLRVETVLQVGKTTSSVDVYGGEAGVITTDTATVQSSFETKEVLQLPANIRTNGNTSSFNIIRFLPGVEADTSGNYTVQGAGFSQTNYSLDGISNQDVTANAPLKSAMISDESVAEIKVQGVGNNAEFGQVGDVTTTSRGGTDQYHGGVFEYHTDNAFNAIPFFKSTKPQYIANDFGGTMSGPVGIPGLRHHTYFFGTYEGYRNPQTQFITDSVPTAAMRGGDFSGISTKIIDPTTGMQFTNNMIPAQRISTQSQGILSLYPLPNTGTATQLANNYEVLRRADYSTNQFDARIDKNITSKQSAFGRFSWKNIDQAIPQQLLVPSETQSDQYRLLALSYNYIIRSNLLNEARFGFTWNSTVKSLPFNGGSFTNSLGLAGIGPTFPFNGLPDVNINNFTGLNTDRGNSTLRSDTTQFTDNLSWIVGHHSLKFGLDYRHIRVTLPLSFVSGNNYGQYNFVNDFTGYSFADFLLGLPQTTAIAILESDANGRTNHYAVYAQDSFRVNQKLTLEYGLRFEFNPAYTDPSGYLGNFDPRIPGTGAIIYPDGQQNLISGNFLQAINACPGPEENGVPCTPINSASEEGLPNSLRTASKRIVPRFGFAYRPFDDRTVIRGGFGLYNVTVLGSIYSSLASTLQADTRTYTNLGPNGQPLFAFPQTQLPGLGNLAALASESFNTAVPIHFKDPYAMQTNFSIERDLSHQTGLRISYIGLQTRQLVWTRDLDQLEPSTTYYGTQIQNRSVLPFPNWRQIHYRDNGANASYNSLQAELRHNYRALTFDAAYTLARNLADNQGPAPNSFTLENANTLVSDSYDRNLDYGPVYGTPRQHLGATCVYQLPYGRGRRFGNNSHAVTNEVLGGWQLSTIFVTETGPYLTPFLNGIDPSGTGSGIAGGSRQRVDEVANPNIRNHDAAQWFNVNAFVCPGGGSLATCREGEGTGANAPIGRYGNQGIGTLIGPGTVVLHGGLAKEFVLGERFRLHAEGTFTNLFNHVNLGDPTLSLNNSQVGTITSTRQSYYAGARSGQVGLRLEF